MTQEEKRIKIAEACGVELMSAGWIPSYNDPDNIGCHPIAEPIDPPDYFNDLNAMHEAEKSMSYEQHCSYADLLNYAIIPGPAANKSTFATAAQRAEAFGKTLKLW